MQLTYPTTNPVGFPGLKAETEFSYTESKKAQNAIDFGKGVTQSVQADSVKTASRNKLTLTFSADLVASNTINGSINGTAIAQVTYATSHANTLALIATAIGTVLTTLGLVGTTAVVAADDTITVTLTGANESGTLLAASWAVTNGASQATIAATYNTGVIFRGVAQHEHRERRADGSAGYADADMVNVLRKGRIWVTVRDAVADGDSAYMCLANTGEEGDFSNVATGNLATGGKFASAAADNGLAVLEINLP